MLKTLTEYLKTFADTGSGCLGAALRSCRGLQGLSLRESRSWGSSGAALGPCSTLLLPHSVQTPRVQGSRAGPAPGCWGRGGREPLSPPEVIQAFAWQHRGPRAVPTPAPARSPHSPSLSPGRDSPLSWHSSAALELPVHRTPLTCPQSPSATRGPGSATALCPKCAGPPTRAAENAQSKPGQSRASRESHC